MSIFHAITGRILASNSYKYPPEHLSAVCAVIFGACLVGMLIILYDQKQPAQILPTELSDAAMIILISTAIILPVGISYMQLYKKNAGRL